MQPIIDERHIEYPLVGLRRSQRSSARSLEQKILLGTYRLERVACLCGNVDGIPVATRDCYGMSVSINLCPTCGIIWTNPRLTEESFAEFYSNEYRALYSHSGISGKELYNRQVEHGMRIYRQVYGFLPQKGGVVFDLNCGTGGVLAAFRNARHRTFGCDTYSDLLRHGRADGFNLEEGAPTVLEKHGPAHLVLLRDVLDRQSNPFDELKCVSSLVQDGWYLYVEVPGTLRKCESLESFVQHLQIARQYYFTAKTLSRLLADAGFELVAGDESVGALYRKMQHVARVDTDDQAAAIIEHLSSIEPLRMSC